MFYKITLMVSLIFLFNFQGIKFCLGFNKNLNMLSVMLKLFVFNPGSQLTSISWKDLVVNQYIIMVLSFGSALI